MNTIMIKTYALLIMSRPRFARRSTPSRQACPEHHNYGCLVNQAKAATHNGLTPTFTEPTFHFMVKMAICQSGQNTEASAASSKDWRDTTPHQRS